MIMHSVVLFSSMPILDSSKAKSLARLHPTLTSALRTRMTCVVEGSRRSADPGGFICKSVLLVCTIAPPNSPYIGRQDLYDAVPTSAGGGIALLAKANGAEIPFRPSACMVTFE